MVVLVEVGLDSRVGVRGPPGLGCRVGARGRVASDMFGGRFRGLVWDPGDDLGAALGGEELGVVGTGKRDLGRGLLCSFLNSIPVDNPIDHRSWRIELIAGYFGCCSSSNS